MDEQRTEQAVQRIEEALARIARSADTMRPAPPSVSALVVKHENLREASTKALKTIDQVIKELQEDRP